MGRDEQLDDPLRCEDMQFGTRLLGQRSKMLSLYQVGRPLQRIVVTVGWLAGSDIERSSADVPGGKRLSKRDLIDQTPTCDVDEGRSSLHLTKALGIDEVAGRFHQRTAEDDDIATFEELVKTDLLDTVDMSRVERRVVAEDVHPECCDLVRHLSADTAHADDARDLAP